MRQDTLTEGMTEDMREEESRQECRAPVDGRMSVIVREKMMVTVAEFVKLSGLGEHSVRRLVHVRGFPALRAGRRYLIHRRKAEEWILAFSIEHRDLAAERL